MKKTLLIIAIAALLTGMMPTFAKGQNYQYHIKDKVIASQQQTCTTDKAVNKKQSHYYYCCS